MNRKFLLLASLFAFGLSAVARATTITAGIYTLNDAFVNGYAVTGTVDLNSSGNVTLADLTFNDASFDNPGLPTFNQIAQTNTYNGLSQNYLTSSNLSGQIDFYFNTTADANGDLDLCIGSAQCGTSNGTTGASALHIYWVPNSTNGTYPVLSNAEFSSGYLAQVETPATALTPEPSSLILLGTGIIGLAGATRFLR